MGRKEKQEINEIKLYFCFFDLLRSNVDFVFPFLFIPFSSSTSLLSPCEKAIKGS